MCFSGRDLGFTTNSNNLQGCVSHRPTSDSPSSHRVVPFGGLEYTLADSTAGQGKNSGGGSSAVQKLLLEAVPRRHSQRRRKADRGRSTSWEANDHHGSEERKISPEIPLPCAWLASSEQNFHGSGCAIQDDRGFSFVIDASRPLHR